ncbi:hypothetical protein M407DRAFT_31150 [Tulasnella calospora MUT 4182]|uniref:Anaphase-promoting complex subunit 4 WD40 domain-containing protein n=1 Tax=Tulasnella calospora MUT 4182 TaxID=1051891 RepID=A0A0C3KCL6_9AGAM|nr:hypothetical protein M407DRAFT_31150 [Tulasnella calospora MUT 4182]
MLKVLITSRPELHIHDQFNYSSLRLSSQSFVLHDIEKSVVNADIQLFLMGRLADLAVLHRVAQPWPTVAEINSLASSSDNLFIFASTTVNFIGGARNGRSLQHRLDQSLRPDLSQRTSTFAQLDALYLRVLETAENDLEETVPNSTETFRLVLETIVLLLDPLPPASLAGLLSLHPDDALTSIQDLRSVLVIPINPDSAEPIRFFHPSFYDFITTPGRGSERFFIQTTDGHARLANLCLQTLHTLLRKDPCSIEDPWSLNSDVADLQARLDGAAPDQLRYSCRFFCWHISLCEPGDGSLEQLLDSFCESNLLMWLEMMSLLGDIDGAINSIQLLKTWCQKNSTVKKLTADLIHDAYRVLLQFQSPLRLCSGHVYTTILSFSPVCGLTEHYASQLHVPYVVRGQPARWDAKLITTDTQRNVLALKFFPDGKRIAMGDDRGRISVWSSSTGAEIISTDASDTDVVACSLDISADGTRIASSIEFEDAVQFEIWDAITGSRIFRLGDLAPCQHNTFIAFLPNGLELLCWSTNGTFSRWDSITGSVLSSHELPVKDRYNISVSRCGSRIVTICNTGLTIWEVRGDGVVSPLQVHLPRDQGDLSAKMPFLIDPSLVLIVDDPAGLFIPNRFSHTPVKVWDYQKGLESQRMTFRGHPRCVTVCEKSRRMAITTTQLPMQIWDLESGTLLAYCGGDASVVMHAAFSPTEMAVASVDSSGVLRTWDIGPIHSGNNSNASETDSHPCRSVSASRSGKNVVSACSGTRVVLWNIVEQTSLNLDVPSLDGHVIMSADGLYFICNIGEPSVLAPSGWALYKTEPLQPLYTWYSLNVGRSERATFSPDGGRIAVTVPAEGFNHQKIEVLDIHHMKILWEAGIKDRVSGIAFFPEGTSLAVVYEHGYEIFNTLSGGESEFSADWNLGSEFEFGFRLGGILPHAGGTQFLLQNFRGFVTASYLVDTNDPSQITKHTESSRVWQIIGTHNGHEPVFLVHDQMGNLYKKSRDSREFLCWLPPAWRFMNGEVPAVWEGSYLIVGLGNGEIGVIDVDALSHN